MEEALIFINWIIIIIINDYFNFRMEWHKKIIIFFKKEVDKNMILCYNIIEVKGRKIKTLVKIKLKYKGEKYE